MANDSQLSSERITRIITLLLRGALLVAAFLAVATKNWSALFAAIGAFGLTYVPRVLASAIHVRLPLQFEAIITLFIYASIFLGEVGDYYDRFWWWDTLLHAGAAFSFGFIGFLVLFLLQSRQKLQASPLLISMFAFSFGLAIGALWEIFEFAVDSLFGLNMQKSGLPDTMGDLIIDTVGAGIASFIGYLNLRYNFRDPYDAFIDWFLRANPRFRGRWRIFNK